MKKFLAIAVSVLFLLGFAASAFAIHAEIPSETQAVVAMGGTQITLGGSIRVRGELRSDMAYNGETESDDKAAWDQRVRVSLQAAVSENVTGMIVLENGDRKQTIFDGLHAWLGATDSDVYTWGEAGDNASGVYPYGNGKPQGIDILEAWILYTNDIVNVKIGHMPLALGRLLFFDHRKFGDDAIVLFKDIDNLHIAALTFKADEDNTALADDTDAYVGLFAYKGDGFNISGDVTWVNDNNFLSGIVFVPIPNFPTNLNADLYNIGVRGDVNISDMFNVYADVELQTGDHNAVGALGCGGAATNCDFGGYAFVLGGTADIDPIKVGIEYGQGSGDDDALDGDSDLFITSLSPGIPYITFVHGTRSANFAGAGNGITNLTYIKGSVSGSPMEKMTAKGDVIWLKATEDYAAGTDDIGLEIDGKVTYKLANGLVYWVEGGYFWVDDAYAQMGGGVTPGQEEDAFAIRHGVELTF